MKSALASVAAAAVAIIFPRAARADHQLYTMEQLYNATGVPDPAGTRPDDFHPNGGGTTVLQDTIGTTEGAHSMKFVQVAGQTFSGAETELLPDHLSDDNSAITMDVTIPETGRFTGTFARLGISEFGSNPNVGVMGVQVQTVIQNEANISLQPGTYRIGVPLIAIANPITFDGPVSFFSCFQPDPMTPPTDTQLIPADWEFYVNKSNDSPLTIYVDNIKIVPLVPGDCNFDQKVNAIDFNIVATNFGKPGQLAQGDFDSSGSIDTGDFTILASHFGQVGPSPALGGLVPEPASAGVVIVGLSLFSRRRSRCQSHCVNMGR